MSKMIRVSDTTHKILNESSTLTGISIGMIVDNLIEEKTAKDIVRVIISKMKKETR